MALTRQQHKVILANSRPLRSGRLLRGPLATRPPVRRPSHTGRTWAPRPYLPGHPAHIDEGTALEQSGPLGVECDTQDGPRPSPATDLIGEESPNPDLQNRIANREQSSPLPSPLRPVILGQGRASTVLGRLESEPLHNGVIISTPPVVVETLFRSSKDQEDFGVPKDGKWDVVAAHEHRFCFRHGEVEWLLEYAERWMYPNNFKVKGPEDSKVEISAAEVALEARLQKYELQPWASKPYYSASRAECNQTLWSHIDSPTQRSKIGEEVIYRIRWKLCWTPESKIDDLNWAESSYDAKIKCMKRRQSARVQDRRRVRLVNQSAIYKAHKEKTVRAERTRSGYPIINWEAFPERISVFDKIIGKIIDGGIPSRYKDEFDHYMGVQNSRRRLWIQLNSPQRAGYYGSRGVEIM